MMCMQLQEWDQIMQAVKGVLWIENIFTGSDELLRDDVMQIVNVQRSETVPVDTVMHSWDEFREN
jgi:hypothetical protein